MKDRLAQFLKLENLTAVKFAEIMEVQPSSISHLLSGRNKPNFDFISRLLLRFPDLNPSWIINGIGEVHKSKIEQSGPKTAEESIEQVTSVNQELNHTPEKCVTDVKQLNLSDLKSPIETNRPEMNVVTDVNAENPNVESSVKSTRLPSEEKRVARVILFFDNGSFEEYHNR